MSQLSEFLRAREDEWAPALRAASLVAEIAAPQDQVREVIRALGRLCWQSDDPHERRRLLAYRYPACLLTGLAGIGAVAYEHGNYWGAVHKLAPGEVEQNLWGETFRDNLDRFRLARFPGLPLVNVGEILMHAGVPAYCIGDLLALLVHRQSRDPGMVGADFLTWALTPGRGSRLNGIDKPVRHFLQYGGDYAEDFVDRCLDLLDRLRQAQFNADGLGLPSHLVTRAQDLAERGLLDWGPASSRVTGVDRPAQIRPYLELEPYGRGLLVSLPAVPEALGGQVVWRLRIDGEVETVTSRSAWPGDYETAPATAHTITRPARQVTVELASLDLTHELDIVDPHDPLMVFTEDGRRVPTTSSLPPEPVWLMYPCETADSRPAELEIVGRAHECAEAPAPYGWLGWTLRRIDLRAVASVRVGHGVHRQVKGSQRARLHSVTPLAGVSGVTGAPVIGTPPLLTLPTDAGVSTAWSIRVRRNGTSQSVHTQSVVITRETTVDPWQGLPRPLVGTYEITVRGPLGRGLNRTLELAEGLHVESEPPWRNIHLDGLPPATVYAGTRVSGLAVTPPTTRLGSTDTGADLQLASAAGASAVRFTPAHMAVQRIGREERAEWSLRPLRLDTETLPEGELLVRLPDVTPATLVVRIAGAEVQTVASAATYGQPLARFSLATIADTVRTRGSARLDVRVAGDDHPVGYCTPRQLASGVRLEGDRLVLADGVRADGLTAGLYRVYAPWQPPHVVPVTPELVSAPLPSDVTSVGALVALLQVEDPWVPVDWPDWPDSNNALAVDGCSWQQPDCDSAATALSGYLAGKQELPDRADVVPLLLDLYPHADAVRARGVTVDVRGTVRLLRKYPAATFAALPGVSTSADQLVAPLVHSGLVAAPVEHQLTECEEAKLWSLNPLAGMLASAHHLSSLEADKELREQIVAVCGEVAGDLLAGDQDPFETVGVFDVAAAQLAELSEADRDRIWRAMRVVPGGLLDADGRAVAARQLFDARTRLGVTRVSREADTLLRILDEPLRTIGGPRVARAVRARQPVRGWRSLPALSLAFAFVARLTARGTTNLARYLPAIEVHHATLARHAPQIVTIDLLLAEFILTGAGASR